MKKIALIIISVFIYSVLPAQTEWRFKSEVEKNDYYLLEGTIADKYPITMYLEESGFFCNYESRWNFSYGIKGWYYYNNFKKKIPLLGSVEESGGESCFLSLFVPVNLLDTINRNSCGIEEYKEVFTTNESCSFTSMKWKKSNQEDWSNVTLNLIQSINEETNAKIILEINGFDFYSFDLSDVTEIEYIESVNLLSSKAIDNNFYLIFSFNHMTNPGSNGHGYCGAGYEEYLGFLHINELFEIAGFEYYLTESCDRYIEQGYGYDEEFPENGIIK